MRVIIGRNFNIKIGEERGSMEGGWEKEKKKQDNRQ